MKAQNKLAQKTKDVVTPQLVVRTKLPLSNPRKGLISEVKRSATRSKSIPIAVILISLLFFRLLPSPPEFYYIIGIQDQVLLTPRRSSRVPCSADNKSEGSACSIFRYKLSFDELRTRSRDIDSREHVYLPVLDHVSHLKDTCRTYLLSEDCVRAIAGGIVAGMLMNRCP